MSKKNVTAIVSGAGWIGGFTHLLVKEMRNQGWTDKEIHALVTETEPEEQPIKKIVANLKPAVRPGLTRSFTLVIDYGRTLAEMVRAGSYDYVNDNITEKNFPIQSPQTEQSVVGEGPYRTPGKVQKDSEELILVHMNKATDTDEVLKYLDKLDLQPANIEELLAFGEKYSDVQREYPIVGLGSVWRTPNGDRHCPYFCGNSGERSLSLYWIALRWNESYRFLARCK